MSITSFRFVDPSRDGMDILQQPCHGGFLEVEFVSVRLKCLWYRHLRMAAIRTSATNGWKREALSDPEAICMDNRGVR